ncbi:MAG: hypothetical protein PHV34_07300 [Verrucomicrobiae bacterium]|nr:hypothetical protein [Verrucomicrobiae bacterium]
MLGVAADFFRWEGVELGQSLQRCRLCGTSDPATTAGPPAKKKTRNPLGDNRFGQLRR